MKVAATLFENGSERNFQIMLIRETKRNKLIIEDKNGPKVMWLQEKLALAIVPPGYSFMTVHSYFFY
jgi:hypothetical protein